MNVKRLFVASLESVTENNMVHKNTSRGLLFGFLAMVILTSSLSSATEGSVAVGGGTLSWPITSTSGKCGYEGTSQYTQWNLGPFTFVVSGNTYPLGGSAAYIESPGGSNCPVPGPEPATGEVLQGSGYQIVLTAEYGGNGSAVYEASGILYPQFKILSILYAAPGNLSNDGFTNTLTDGTSTSVGSSFQAGDTITFSEGFSFAGLGSTMSWSFGTAVTTGYSTEVTDTISEAVGVGNDSNSGASNAINHQNDLFIIWLNPSVSLLQTGSTSATYSVGTQLQTTGDPLPGQPEAVDSLEVYAGVMMANSKGVTTVPAAILNAQTVSVAGQNGSQTLPGLGSICKNHPYYPNSCTLANQCGCVPADFAAILATDPLLNFTNTESPLNANNSNNPDRFVEITGAELLAGPEEKGGNNPVNSFTESDSTETTETWTYSIAYSVGYSWEVSWQVDGNGPKLQSATMFTWTNTDSVGESNGSAHQEAVSLSSNTVGCYEDISIFEDTVFHTFAFQQPAGNNSCP
jgi:hypothetical protein